MVHMSCILLIGLVWCLWTPLHGAEFNCYRRPPPLSNFQYCCQLPRANINLFPPQCRQYAQFDIFGQNKLCGMECMFSVSASLRNNKLDMSNVRSMLEQVYENSDIADAKYSSYEDCSSLIEDKLQRAQRHYYPNYSYNYQNRYRWFVGPQCSPYAAIYAECAQVKLMKYCPDSFWRENAVCESIKEFVENCEDQLFSF